MPWFRVDDTLSSHPKARAAGLAAMGLWSVAGAYSMQYLTEGLVPDWYVQSWPGGTELADQLVAVGLWSREDDGWRFHQWAERQPTKEYILAEREKNRQRQAKWRERHAANRDTHRDSDGSNAPRNAVTDEVTDAPTNGCPIPNPAQSSSNEEDARPDVEALCTRLADRIEDNGSKRPNITKAWRDEARRMIDIDHRDPDRAANLIDWCQASDFWKPNILSMKKFRDKYDQLRLQAIADWRQNGGPRHPDGEIDVDAILGSERFVPPTPPEDIEAGTLEYARWMQEARDEWRADRERRAREVLARREAS